MKLVVGTRSSKLAIAQTNIFLNGYKNICNWYAEEDQKFIDVDFEIKKFVTQGDCLLYTSPSPRDLYRSRMPSSA